MDKDIMTENGKAELELLEFIVSGNSYGINVEKVREVLPMPETTPIPNSKPCIDGMFMLRENIITVINSSVALNLEEVDVPEGRMLIVTNFNSLNIAFMVEKIEGIHYIDWKDVLKPDETANEAGIGVATGVIKRDDKLMIMLDFECIIENICPETALRVSDIEYMGERERNTMPIILAEDSPMLRRLVIDSLKAAGYISIYAFEDGEDAWNKLKKLKEDKKIDEGVKCIITDIEMPRMDGHRLIKNIREDFVYDNVPIIIFSSLINEETKRKGKNLGADEHITKPEIGKLVQVIDDLIINGRRSNM